MICHNIVDKESKKIFTIIAFTNINNSPISNPFEYRTSTFDNRPILSSITSSILIIFAIKNPQAL